MIKRTVAIKRFLIHYTHPDLAEMYNHDMECQVNVSQGKGQRIDLDFKGKGNQAWSDGIQKWYPFRIPKNAKTEPVYEDVDMSYNLEEHAEGIGMTGWNWKEKKSKWVAFDFDFIVGHSDKHNKKLTESELLQIIDQTSNVEWITLRKSTGGQGLHLYVFLADCELVKTNNHNEHAALARAILGKLSALVGYDFKSKVDVCMSADTWTLTTEGPRQVRDLIDKNTTIVLDGKSYKTKGFFYTGYHEVFEIETVEGYKIKATKNHKILTRYESGVRDFQYNCIDLDQEVKNLKSGDKIHLTPHYNFEWEGQGNYNEGYILGWLFGDGCFSNSREKYLDWQHGLYFYPDDHCLLHFVNLLFTKETRIVKREESNSYIIRSPELEELKIKYGCDVNKDITQFIEQASSDFLKGFISAFFDTDGGLGVGTSIVLTQSNKQRLEALQRILLRFGIKSIIRKEKEAGTTEIQGRKCKRKEKYTLSIYRENVLIFNQRIGFKNPVKQEENLNRINKALSGPKKILAKEKFLATIKSIKSVGFEEVYDINVPDINHFDANGICVHNCGGNMWIWHRKMQGTEGLKLIKKGTVLTEDQIPVNWKDHIHVVKGTRKKNLPKFIEEIEVDETTRLFNELTEQRNFVQLDDSHKSLIKYFEDNSCMWWWDQDNHLLVTHTIHIKEAHRALGMKGIFETNSQGTEQGDYNSFLFPLRHGMWSIRRFTPGVQEHESWTQDGAGWTQCFLNRDPDLATVSRAHGGIEHDKGGFIFREGEVATQVATVLGANLDLPLFLMGRQTKLKQHKDGRLIVEVKKEETDQASDKLMSWISEKGVWKKIFNIKIAPPLEPEIQNYDGFIRHVVTETGEDYGWMLRNEHANMWTDEPLVHVKTALRSTGLTPRDCDNVVGQCVTKCWILTNRPFQPEYPGDRLWNRNAVQFRFPVDRSKDPSTLTYPSWTKILNHLGLGLNSAIMDDKWCKTNGILLGADYLKLWIASLFQEPSEPLPYLFFYGSQDCGKSTLHEALSVLVTHGVARADNALVGNFNGELENAILCAVEEIDLKKNKTAYAKIKDWVTSRMLPIHAKNRTPYLAPNTTHWIQTANESSACPIFPGDKRIVMIHVEDLKPEDKVPKKDFIVQLQKEASDFLTDIMMIELPASNDRLNIPIITTQEKIQAEETNKTLFELFLDENCIYVPGQLITFGSIYDEFQCWCDPNQLHNWPKQKLGKELPAQFAKGKLYSDAHKHYIANIRWKYKTQTSLPERKIVSKMDRLVYEDNTDPPNPTTYCGVVNDRR